MTLYPSDLAFMTPDANGDVKLNRGTTAQVKVPFPGFLGEVKFYRGKAEDVGKGELVGWSIVAGISAGTLVRIATLDTDVGLVTGSNILQPTAQAPTASLVMDPHDHGINVDNGTTDASSDTRTVTAGAANASGTSHTHKWPHDHGSATDPEPGSGTITVDPLVLDPVTISPQAMAFYLIEYVGIVSA